MKTQSELGQQRCHHLSARHLYTIIIYLRISLAIEKGAFQSRVKLRGLGCDIRIGVCILFGEIVVVQLGVQVLCGDKSISLGLCMLEQVRDEGYRASLRYLGGLLGGLGTLCGSLLLSSLSVRVVQATQVLLRGVLNECS